MTLEEKTKFIEESKEKNYLFISPKIIKGGVMKHWNYMKIWMKILKNLLKKKLLI